MSIPTGVEDSIVAEIIVVPKDKKSTRENIHPKKQPPYAVIVHNDECHTFPYVIEMLRRVCAYPLAKSIELTQRIPYTGQAAVWTGALEVAELKRDQIRGYGPDFYAHETVRFPLAVSIEPLPSD